MDDGKFFIELKEFHELFDELDVCAIDMKELDKDIKIIATVNHDDFGYHRAVSPTEMEMSISRFKANQHTRFVYNFKWRVILPFFIAFSLILGLVVVIFR